MKRKYFLQLIILFFSLLLPACGFAAEKISSAEAENWANYKGEEILNILADKNLAQKYEKLDKIIFLSEEELLHIHNMDSDSARSIVKSCKRYIRKKSNEISEYLLEKSATQKQKFVFNLAVFPL